MELLLKGEVEHLLLLIVKFTADYNEDIVFKTTKLQKRNRHLKTSKQLVTQTAMAFEYRTITSF